MDEKLYCHVCKEFKETSQFSPCKKAKLRNGKSYVCKQCQALAQRQRREKQKDIDLLDFTLVFIVAVLFAFYIEYNNSNSKLMVILREYF